LPEFIDAIGGQSEFQKRLDEFDRMNQELISVYNHHLHRLEQMLMPHERPLIEQLRPLTDLLYWRRRP
jgi:octaprenyl-diphosphate synthase